MEFEAHAVIHRPLEDVFGFFRDIDQHAGREGSVVPVYDKITPGPVRVGTRYREVVRFLPLLKGEVLTEVTGYDPPLRIDYKFVVFGKMEGELTYRLEPVGEEGVQVLQRQTLRPRGNLKLLAPLIGAAFSRAMTHRLKGIKEILETKASP